MHTPTESDRLNLNWERLLSNRKFVMFMTALCFVAAVFIGLVGPDANRDLLLTPTMTKLVQCIAIGVGMFLLLDLLLRVRFAEEVTAAMNLCISAAIVLAAVLGLVPWWQGSILLLFSSLCWAGRIFRLQDDGLL